MFTYIHKSAKYIKLTVLSLLVLFASHSIMAQNRDCRNAGLENGHFGQWTGSIGTYTGFGNAANVNSGLTLNAAVLPAGNRISLVTPGMDNNVPIQRVYSGGFAIKLGNEPLGNNAERVVYSVPITNNNKIFRYNYAVVLQIPNNHQPSEMPFFWARVMVNNNVICETGRKTAGTGDPFFQSAGGFEFRDWDCMVCDLSAYVGQTVTVEFTVAQCSLGGHFGYAYIDGLCEGATINTSFQLNKEVYCKDEAITMDATATVGETYYYLTVEESDANMGRPNPASEMILHFPNQTVGIENIKQIFEQNGFVFQCNMYYRVKLAVGNNCSSWNELVKLIYISCPEVNAGRDICVDCDRPTISRLIPIGHPNNSTASHLDYQWSPPDGISDPDAPYTTHMEHSVNYPITYTLHVTDNKSGCTNSDQVTVQCTVEKGTIIKESTCCGIKLTLDAPPYFTNVVWSTGEIGVNEIVVRYEGTYTVTYSNSCSSITLSIDVTAQDIADIERYYADLTNSSIQSYYSSGSNINSYNAFYIMNVENPTPPYGEYHATEYRLDIYDRWGAVFHQVFGAIEDCQGFSNPAIQWDGTVNGTQVQNGVYNARLYMKNCEYKDWEEVKVHYCTSWNFVCTDWDCEFWLGSFDCGFFTKEFCVSGYTSCATTVHSEIFPITIIF